MAESILRYVVERGEGPQLTYCFQLIFLSELEFFQRGGVVVIVTPGERVLMRVPQERQGQVRGSSEQTVTHGRLIELQCTPRSSWLQSMTGHVSSSRRPDPFTRTSCVERMDNETSSRGVP